MKPVLLSLCLILLFMAGTASASVEDCPTCGFLNDVSDLITNPYSGCPTCIFSYNANGSLAEPNAYSGCPTCTYAYDANGSLIINAHTGCTSCRVSSGMTTNTLGSCPSCTFSSGASGGANVYRFPNGTAILDDNGRYLITDKSGNQYYSYGLPDKESPYGYFADGTPIPEGYWNPQPTVANVQVPVKLQHTSAEFISLFKRPTILPFSDRWKSVLNQ
jgi:hypothetical protein